MTVLDQPTAPAQSCTELLLLASDSTPGALSRVGDPDLIQLLRTGVSRAELEGAALQCGGMAGVIRRVAILDALDRGGLIRRDLRDAAGTYVSLRPVGGGPTSLPPMPPQWHPQPFVDATVHAGDLVLQAPDGAVAAHLSPRATVRWLQLSAGTDPEPADGPLLRSLLAARVIGPDQPSPGAASWSKREWTLHRQLRNPRVSPGFAGTGRHQGADPVAPASPGGPRHRLRVPDLALRARTEPAFVDLAEQRESRRDQDDDHPIDVDQLGELLYRTARETARMGGDPALIRRPVPAGGALHEIEVVVVVRQCSGLAAGMWQYDGRTHELVLLAEAGPATDALLRSAATAAMNEPPQVLVVFAARFGRLMQKYEAMGYGLTLKHVGALMHAMQLTGEALALACCPLGAGHPDAFEEATGADPFVFGPVGELMLGSRRQEVR